MGKHAKMSSVKKVKVLRGLTKKKVVTKRQAVGMFFDRQSTGKRR